MGAPDILSEPLFAPPMRRGPWSADELAQLDALYPMHGGVGGMSLRDHFAAKAMQGLVSGHFAKYGHEDYWPRPEIASEAYEIADAMLAARKPNPNQ